MLKPFKLFLVFNCVLLLIPFFISSCATSIPYKTSYEHAQLSYALGDYPRAFRELWLPVRYKDPRAMYAMGYMYYYGIGTNKDEDLGLSLIHAAAKRHCPSAIIALKLITENKYKQYAPLEPYDSYTPRGSKA